jgi:hypothetical protein
MRALLAVAAAVLAGTTAMLGGVHRADAASVAPTAQAWWYAANGGGAPAAPAPGVGARDLLVAGSKGDQSLPSAGRAGAPSPFSSIGDKGAASALAAVRYTIPAGQAVDRLVLKFDSSPQSSVSMAACAITGRDFKAEQAGPWSDVPPYDCTTPSLGSLTPDGTAVQFTDVGGLASGAVLSVVIVPQYAAYSVLLPPGADSLVLRTAPAPFDAGSLPPAFDSTAFSSSSSGSVPPASLSGAAFTVPPTDVATPPPAPAVAPAAPPSRATIRPAQPAVAIPGLDDGRARLASAFGLAAMLAAFAWMAVGDTPRLRRLLAARLAGPGVTLPAPAVTRGVGRFRRERVGRPPEV